MTREQASHQLQVATDAVEQVLDSLPLTAYERVTLTITAQRCVEIRDRIDRKVAPLT